VVGREGKEPGMKVSVTWTCVNTRESTVESCPTKAPLHALKLMALAELPDMKPGMTNDYDVKRTPTGEAVDEKQCLEDLGITTDGSTLYLVHK
jgi:hypothetical protein